MLGSGRIWFCRGWKHWPNAVAFSLRGLLVHRLWLHIWHTCQTDLAENADLLLGAMDTDAADANPSLRQRIRARKVTDMLEAEDAAAAGLHRFVKICHSVCPGFGISVLTSIKALFAKCVITTKPLVVFMHRVSLVEALQARLRLRRQGLRLPGSQRKGSCVPEEVVRLNAEILTGEAGWDCIGAYSELLDTPADAALWRHDLGVQKEQCLALILLGVCDCFRRLVLPFEAMPYQMFRLLDGTLNDALQLAKSMKRQHGSCDHCRDPLFAEAATL